MQHGCVFLSVRSCVRVWTGGNTLIVSIGVTCVCVCVRLFVRIQVRMCWRVLEVREREAGVWMEGATSLDFFLFSKGKAIWWLILDQLPQCSSLDPP